MSPACRRPLNSLFEKDLQVRAESTDSNSLKNVEITGRWRSGQSQQTVNLPPNGLRRFEPSPPHQTSQPMAREGCSVWWRCLFGGKPRFTRRRGDGVGTKVGRLAWKPAEGREYLSGRVTAFQAVGRGFDPRLPLQPSLARGSGNASFEWRSLLLFAGSKDGRCEQRPTCRPYRVGGFRRAEADVAQLAERVLGKDEVTSSILVIGSTLRSRYYASELRMASHSGLAKGAHRSA